MNSIEVIRKMLAEQFPSAQTNLEPPDNPNGGWFLDVTLGNRRAVIEWRLNHGFGVSDCSCPDSHGYGEGPDKVFRDHDAAFQGVANILQCSELTENSKP